MNTKSLFTLLVVVLIATACAPAIVDSSAPSAPVVQRAHKEASGFVPVTGQSAAPAAREAQESRRWSGEVFLSDTSNPDLTLNNDVRKDQQPITACMSEDSLPRRQSGCTE